MEMKTYYLILGLLINLILPSNREYSVSLYGIPVADVIIDIKDTIYNDTPAIKLDYKTKTNKLTSTIFKVDNIYETIIDQNTLQILSFKKSTFQPNVVNHLYTEYDDNMIKYSDSQTIIPEQCFNIFSLLYYLSNESFDLIQDSVLVEREGLMYNCQLLKTQINDSFEFELKFELINDINHAVIEHTDIFTWALFKPDGNNKIIINKSEIQTCQFKSGLTNLKASIK